MPSARGTISRMGNDTTRDASDEFVYEVSADPPIFEAARPMPGSYSTAGPVASDGWFVRRFGVGRLRGVFRLGILAGVGALLSLLVLR